jgi:DNA-binding Xre family transcriptional regulator
VINNEVAEFKVHLKKWLLRKSEQQGERITQREVAAATGLSLPTISRMYTTGKAKRLEADTVAALLQYFGCKYDDLIEFEE